MKNDKQKHITVGRLIGIVTLPVAFIPNMGFWWALLLTFIFGSLIFVGKEIVDKYKPQPTGFDRIDLAADYIGYAQAVVVSYLLYQGWQIYLLIK